MQSCLTQNFLKDLACCSCKDKRERKKNTNGKNLIYNFACHTTKKKKNLVSKHETEAITAIAHRAEHTLFSVSMFHAPRGQIL